MRIWDINPKFLCHKHLVAEHRELHGLWNILTKHRGRGGYSHHPETKRWISKLRALYLRHEVLVNEMKKRDYRHLSPLDKKLATGLAKQNILINTIKEQKDRLRAKPCKCFVDVKGDKSYNKNRNN